MTLKIFVALLLLQTVHAEDDGQPIAPEVAGVGLEPWALGGPPNIERAAWAAIRCGLRGVSVRQFHGGLSKGRAVLFTRGPQSALASDCMDKWIAKHEKDFDPLLGVE